MSLREELRQEIDQTQVAFHQLLDSIPEEAFGLPSDNPAWTVGEVLYHMSVAPRFVGLDVKMIVRQNWIYHIIAVVVPKALFDGLNKKLTQFGARKLSRDFLSQEYDKAHKSALRALDSVSDPDFDKHLYYPDWDPLLSGDVTLERLFHYVKAHFDSHAGQIREIVESNKDSMGGFQ
jgi:hypothetical protein